MTEEWKLHHRERDCYAVVLADLQRRRDGVINAIMVVKDIFAARPPPSFGEQMKKTQRALRAAASAPAWDGLHKAPSGATVLMSQQEYARIVSAMPARPARSPSRSIRGKKGEGR